jgi:hypothetical protein
MVILVITPGVLTKKNGLLFNTTTMNTKVWMLTVNSSEIMELP